jgi:hypothetical protein
MASVEDGIAAQIRNIESEYSGCHRRCSQRDVWRMLQSSQDFALIRAALGLYLPGLRIVRWS